MSMQPSNDNNYYMDFGASSHMSFNQGTMHSLTPCSSKFIMVGNGAILSVNSIGQFFPFSNDHLSPKNVLISDKMVKNLIYVRRFTIDKYVFVEFDHFGFTVKDLSMGAPLQ